MEKSELYRIDVRDRARILVTYQVFTTVAVCHTLEEAYTAVNNHNTAKVNEILERA